MVWGVLVVAVATGILFSSFFTETWAREARDAAQLAEDRDSPPADYRLSRGRQRRLQAITRWLRTAASLYLLIGLLVDWLCVNSIR